MIKFLTLRIESVLSSRPYRVKCTPLCIVGTWQQEAYCMGLYPMHLRHAHGIKIECDRFLLLEEMQLR